MGQWLGALAPLLLLVLLLLLPREAYSKVINLGSMRVVDPSTTTASKLATEHIRRGVYPNGPSLWRPQVDGLQPMRSGLPNQQTSPPAEWMSNCAPDVSGAYTQADKDRAPWSRSWNNSIALCATIRQATVSDVEEWLSYYKYVPDIPWQQQEMLWCVDSYLRAVSPFTEHRRKKGTHND
jgi:hypothetical protein